MSLPTNPINRKEAYLNAIATGNTVDMPAKPITREEAYLDAIAKNGGGGGGGTTNYNALDNKPQIAGTTLQGNKSLADLGIASEDAVEDIYAVMGEMGAKNLIPYPYYHTTKTENGVTFIDNGDGTVKMSTVAGGATAATRFYMQATADKFCFKKGVEYIMTDGTSDSGSSTYMFVVALYNGNSYINVAHGTVNGVVRFTLPDNDTYDRVTIYITVSKNTIRTTPVLFKPMLRLASDTDDTYQQYAKTNKQLTDEIANKVDKVEGKGLSTNDYDNTEKGKVADNASAIEAIVNVNGCCNILNVDAVSDTINGVTFTVNPDKSVSIYGTASAVAVFLLRAGMDVRAGRYKLTGGIGDYINIGFTVDDNTRLADQGNGVEFDVNESIKWIQIVVGTEAGFVDETLYPMIYDARLKPTGYVPYAMTNEQLTERVKVTKGTYTSDSSMATISVTKLDGYYLAGVTCNHVGGYLCSFSAHSSTDYYVLIMNYDTTNNTITFEKNFETELILTWIKE